MRLTLALTLLLAGAGLAQDAARMDQIVQAVAANRRFTGTILVARGGQVIFSKGYGFANLEWDIPNTPDTKFRLGSVTKQFTAASILLLEERGKLKVDDPVKKYMPDAPAAWDKVTIFHLLTHTSGIPSFTGFPDYAKLEPFPSTPAGLVARFRDKPLEFQPGEKWAYNNSGYVLLGYLLEKITGETYERFVTDNIFTPLGMKDSGYDSNSAIIPRRAEGYVAGKNGFQHAGYIDMTIPLSAGALYSTTLDLLKWQQGLYGGKLLQPASLARMTTPFKNNYAFGLDVGTPPSGHRRFSHGGGIEGFNTELEYYPDDKLTVVVLENANGATPPEEIARSLALSALGLPVTLPSERQETAVSPELLARYSGAYRLPQGPAVLITHEGNHLIGKLGVQPEVPFFPQSETLFFAKAVDAQIEFTADASQLTIHQNGRDTIARRLDAAQAKVLMEEAVAVAKRLKDQTAAPGSEAALRKMIEGLRQGKPDFDMMSSNLAEATRRQLPQLQTDLNQLGAIRTVTFKGVGPAGPDIYLVKLENGSVECRIWMAPDGKVQGLNFAPLQ
ncbi:MAG: serine hydrolase [Acidobacteria bacterium]|nr:serine hydrolase [Acidobacteriota bacterium]